MTRAITSDNMWKESATSAMEFVTYPTVISIKKNNVVSDNMKSSLHRAPLLALEAEDDVSDDPPMIILISIRKDYPISRIMKVMTVV